MTYAIDAMIPVKVGEPSCRRIMFDEEQNVKVLIKEIYLVEEFKNEARILEETCKRRVTWKYNSKLKRTNFIASDLVWRMRGQAQKDHSEGKLAPNWEGPI